jgi:hypothetical protein
MTTANNNDRQRLFKLPIRISAENILPDQFEDEDETDPSSSNEDEGVELLSEDDDTSSLSLFGNEPLIIHNREYHLIFPELEYYVRQKIQKDID